MPLLSDLDKLLAGIVALALIALLLNRASKADEVITDAGNAFGTLLGNMILVDKVKK